MALIKNDVTDQDIEKLFDQNDSSAFKDKAEESLVPKELDVKSNSSNKISRPDEYQPDEVHQKKLQERKDEQTKLQNLSQLVHLTGSVTKAIFNEIVKARQKAQLEEFVSKQRKIPRIAPTARYPLYGKDKKCTFHVYQPLNILEGSRFQCGCKFCSHERIFTAEQWKLYQIENQEFM